MKLRKTVVIEVDQGSLGDCQLSYNPDDGRYYVAYDEESVASFAEWRNAVQFAKRKAGQA